MLTNSINDLDLAAMREKHRPYCPNPESAEQWCVGCEGDRTDAQPWPCLPARLIHRVDLLQQQVRSLDAKADLCRSDAFREELREFWAADPRSREDHQRYVVEQQAARIAALEAQLENRPA